MPDRKLCESIRTSESINRLTAFEETMFYRLLVSCDSEGCMDARPKVLRSTLYPLKDVRDSQMEDALRSLSAAELVTLFEKNGKPFVRVINWDRYQNTRKTAAKAATPPPDPQAKYRIILVDKTYFDVTQKMIDEYRGLYPAVDVEQEFRKMVGWCDANPNNRKTRTGAKRFINSWLSRAQDRARRTAANQETTVYIPNPGLEDWN